MEFPDAQGSPFVVERRVDTEALSPQLLDAHGQAAENLQRFAKVTGMTDMRLRPLEAWKITHISLGTLAYQMATTPHATMPNLDELRNYIDHGLDADRHRPISVQAQLIVAHNLTNPTPDAVNRVCLSVGDPSLVNEYNHIASLLLRRTGTSFWRRRNPMIKVAKNGTLLDRVSSSVIRRCLEPLIGPQIPFSGVEINDGEPWTQGRPEPGRRSAAGSTDLVFRNGLQC